MHGSMEIWAEMAKACEIHFHFDLCEYEITAMAPIFCMCYKLIDSHYIVYCNGV